MLDMVTSTKGGTAKSRKQIAKVSRELSLLQVRTSPSDRRGLLFGRIVSEGLLALRPNLNEDVSGLALDQAAECALKAMASMMGGAPDEVLARKVATLEQRVSAESRFTTRQLAKMRSLRTFGMTYGQIAETYGSTADEIRGLLTGKWRLQRGAGLSKPEETMSLTFDAD